MTCSICGMNAQGSDNPKRVVVKLASRVARGVVSDKCAGYAAQMAFYFLFALFPFLLFLTTLLAYLPVPNLVGILLRILGRFVPGDVLSLVERNLRSLVSVQQGGLLSIGAALSLWTGSNAVIVVMAALNNAFEIKEQRPWWKVRASAVLLVIAFSLFVIVSLLLLILGPRMGDLIASLAGLGDTFPLFWKILRWPIILCLMVTALSALYRFAPAAWLSWRETIPGAATGTGAWVAVSLVFSSYVNNFGSYDRTYGSIGAVIVLLVWMYASSFVILLGGETNARLRELRREQETGTNSRGGGQMRKAIIAPDTRSAISDEQEWLDLTGTARAELTSEDPSYPIESALAPQGEAGWRALEPGRQTIRLLFDEPLRITRVNLEFHEAARQRTQEFVVRWSPDNGRSYREIVRQQYTFAPPGSSREVEVYAIDLVGVTVLELVIVPDISGGDVRASLVRLRLA